jgi:predicted DsbA family dithiol-disulfide isomerase
MKGRGKSLCSGYVAATFFIRSYVKQSVNTLDPSPVCIRRTADEPTSTPTLAIEVFFDFVCPWCLIGKRHLRTALQRLAEMRPEVQVRVDWRSQQLLPHIPPEGVAYQPFYIARLGSAEAVAMRRAQVQQAGNPAGIQFAFERIEVMPNTAAAHALAEWAAEHGSEARWSALIESLFVAYFIEGEDIGERAVLRRRAIECGFDAAALDAHLASGASPRDGRFMARRPAPDYGPTGLPFYVFNGRAALPGAQPPDALLYGMLRSLPA